LEPRGASRRAEGGRGVRPGPCPALAANPPSQWDRAPASSPRPSPFIAIRSGRCAGRERGFGDVFTLRLTTVRPLVVVASAAEVEPLLTADPQRARAGEARREMLPMASPRSIFGSDGSQHDAARRRVAGLFAPEAVARRAEPIAGLAAEHVAGWPRGRPFRLLPRLRALVDEVFARELLGIRERERGRAVAAAIQRMLWTPGNPPLSVPGEGDGLLGAAGAALFARRRAPLARLLAEEIEDRRARGQTGADVLGCLLSAEPAQPTEAMVDELLALLMAAQEPAAAALSWLLERLAREPGLSEAFAAGPAASTGVVDETLRRRPAAIAALRRLSAPATVAGHDLPAGVTVMLPIVLLQRESGAFLPFGGGGRRCLGEPLFRTYVDAIVPVVLRSLRLSAAWPAPERMVLRGTILVPHRGALMLARAA
jgi:cytochrome P450 family 135